MQFPRIVPSPRAVGALLAVGVAALAVGFGSARPGPDAALTPAPADPRAALETGCAVDVGYPIELEITLLGEARPGGRVDARVEIGSKMLLDEVRVVVKPPRDVQVIAPLRSQIGSLIAGDRRTDLLSLRLPDDERRRTVEVTVEGYTDGHLLTRSAVINLLPGGEEPHRIVTTSDGRRIREVPARRID